MAQRIHGDVNGSKQNCRSLKIVDAALDSINTCNIQISLSSPIHEIGDPSQFNPA
jgi:hypothetical protein